MNEKLTIDELSQKRQEDALMLHSTHVYPEPSTYTGFCVTDNFSRVYPRINNWLLELPVQSSRAGNTQEILDFKTVLTNPYRRIAGGYRRDINIFFLLAEAMWIFAGRKDVSFLTKFNKRMSEFSDDGNVFHAPYGFRIRHWGVRAEDKFVEENMHAAQGHDQLADAIRLFAENPDTRQVVLSIWNTDFDLGARTKDMPCNDMVMMKIRNGRLMTTVQNRSNDLHWGLPTNIFQFSFLSELVSLCLGIKMGTQTHNSQSLHIYDWNDISIRMEDAYKVKVSADESGSESPEGQLYEIADAIPIDYSFNHEVAGNRLRELDMTINIIIDNLNRVSEGGIDDINALSEVYEKSTFFYNVYHLLKSHLLYKIEPTKERRDRAIEMVEYIYKNEGYSDIRAMALNWYMKRNEQTDGYIGKL